MGGSTVMSSRLPVGSPRSVAADVAVATPLRVRVRLVQRYRQREDVHGWASSFLDALDGPHECRVSTGLRPVARTSRCPEARRSHEHHP